MAGFFADGSVGGRGARAQTEVCATGQTGPLQRLLGMEIGEPVAVDGDGLVSLLDSSVDEEFLAVLGERIFIVGRRNGHNLCLEKRQGLVGGEAASARSAIGA